MLATDWWGQGSNWLQELEDAGTTANLVVDEINMQETLRLFLAQWWVKPVPGASGGLLITQVLEFGYWVQESQNWFQWVEAVLDSWQWCLGSVDLLMGRFRAKIVPGQDLACKCLGQNYRLWDCAFHAATTYPWRREWQLTPVLLPGEFQDGRPWWAAVHGVAQSQTWLKRLSMHTYIGEGNGSPLQYSCLVNPRDRGAWWAAVYGFAQSRTGLTPLSSSSSSSTYLLVGKAGPNARTGSLVGKAKARWFWGWCLVPCSWELCPRVSDWKPLRAPSMGPAQWCTGQCPWPFGVLALANISVHTVKGASLNGCCLCLHLPTAFLGGTPVSKIRSNSCFCYCSVTRSCLALCRSLDYSMPGSSAFHYCPECAEIHVHWVGYAI